MKARQRLFVTTGGKLCNEDHPEKAVLVAAKGQTVPGYLLEQYGLTQEDVKAHVSNQPEGEEEADEAKDAPAEAPAGDVVTAHALTIPNQPARTVQKDRQR